MSEKLTKRKDYGCACWNGDQNLTTHGRYMKMLGVLAEYEELCFDESGNDVISLARLRELAEAERETYRNATQVTGYCPICAERAKQEQQEPKPRDWTPCAEGTPIRPDGKDIKRDWYIVTLETGMVTLRAYEFDERSPFGYGFHEQNIIPVIAWQPLPAPYNPDHIGDANKKVEEDADGTET